jgi:hypothetical protein
MIGAHIAINPRLLASFCQVFDPLFLFLVRV